VQERLRAALPEADGLIVGQLAVGGDLIAAAPGLRVIAVHGVGVDGIELEAARRHGVVVANVPGANHEAVADLTLCLLLALTRRVVEASAATRAGRWERFVGVELGGRTLGIVGLGRVGRAVAVRAAAFGMTLIAHDPFVEAPPEEVELTTLDDLLTRADAVTLHAPGDRLLLGAAELARMKPGALLINTARGALVDEAALHAALASGRLGGAGLDTFAVEPPAGSPLLALDNVIATPHMGGHTREAIARMSLAAARSVVAVLEGGEPSHRVA
jgi:D-3-phosphoglycerate dehydrogenase